MTVVEQMPAFNYNPELFWDADPKHAKARIPPAKWSSRHHWIDLSKEHYGIHGTPEPSKIGHTASHGCVRLTNWDAQRLARWGARERPSSSDEALRTTRVERRRRVVITVGLSFALGALTNEALTWRLPRVNGPTGPTATSAARYRAGTNEPPNLSALSAPR